MEVALYVLYGTLLLIQTSNIIYLRRFRRARTGREPSVTILVPARNEEDNLRRLIPSILHQDYPTFELIVYDDDSDDGTADVLHSFDDDRLRTLRGSGPPQGWVGKVHALYQAAKSARGKLFLFLDADAELLDGSALSRLVARYHALGDRRVLTGFTDLRGGGLLLVSLVPHTIVSFLSAFLAERSRSPILGSLNGQCWIISAASYRELQPHEHVAGEVLEDVSIGRFLKSRGIHPAMVDVRGEVAVHMYKGIREAWVGFRKNAYLLMGGSAVAFVPWFLFYGMLFVAVPLTHLHFLAAVYVLKLVSDRAAGIPLWVTALTPVTHLASWALQLDSAVSHWTGRATWKGRRV